MPDNVVTYTMFNPSALMAHDPGPDGKLPYAASTNPWVTLGVLHSTPLALPYVPTVDRQPVMLPILRGEQRSPTALTQGLFLRAAADIIRLSAPWVLGLDLGHQVNSSLASPLW